MEKYLLIIGLVLIFASCSGEKIKKMTYPEDLAGKKELLRKKKTELKTTKDFIRKLETEIAELDTVKREKPRTLVTTKPVQRKDFKRFINIQASVVSDDLVSASSETGGRVLKQDFREGDAIRKGALIATIDMETVNKQIAELETSLELANDMYSRLKRLQDQEIGSEVDFLQAKNNKERLGKSIETLRHQLTKASVYAPISGVVDRVFVKSGEMAGPGTPILHILDTRKVKVVAEVPENYLRAIRLKEKVNITFPALDKETTGRISLIGRTINPANRTFKVEVEMSNKSGMLKPNLLAEMKINDFTEKNALIVPIDLVQQEVSGRDFIYVTKTGREGPFAKKVFIETGESADGEIIVISGLEGNEEIIVDGARTLSDNVLLKIEAVAEKSNDNLKSLNNG